VIPANRQRNYLQSALYVAIVAVLATLLLGRLLDYAEAAEKAGMETTLAQVHQALYAHVALLAMRGEYEALEALSGENPFVGSGGLGSNYAGEFAGNPPDASLSGIWYFDRTTAELVYRPRHASHLIVPQGQPQELRYRIEVKRLSKRVYTGVTVRPVANYRWDPLP
jgi:hypothetical protein